MSTPKIEVLFTWDPDGGGDFTLFVDGVRTDNYCQESVDPGRGYMLTDWIEDTRQIAADESYSPAFRAAVLSARAEGQASRYVEDDRDPPVDVAWGLHGDDPRVELWEDYANLTEEQKDLLDGFACEQVSRALVARLREAHHDAWLIHGSDPDEADGMVGDHWWVGVDDDGSTLNIDLTGQQFLNVTGHEDDAELQEWPMFWHTNLGAGLRENRHVVIDYRTFTEEN